MIPNPGVPPASVLVKMFQGSERKMLEILPLADYTAMVASKGEAMTARMTALNESYIARNAPTPPETTTVQPGGGRKKREDLEVEASEDMFDFDVPEFQQPDAIELVKQRWKRQTTLNENYPAMLVPKVSIIL